MLYKPLSHPDLAQDVLFRGLYPVPSGPKPSFFGDHRRNQVGTFCGQAYGANNKPFLGPVHPTSA